MDKIIKNKYLNINSLLINMGLMSGHLHDGMIASTKFGRFNLWFSFGVCIFCAVKWSILLFFPKDSEMSNWLGDWGNFYGPKLIFNSILIFLPLYIITVKILFILMSKHSEEMFYWLDVLEYGENESFNKLNLTETDLKKFIKRLSLSIFLFTYFLNSFVIFFVVVNLFSIFKHHTDYIISYLISTLLSLPQVYINVQFIFGFLVMLYPVSKLSIC